MKPLKSKKVITTIGMAAAAATAAFTLVACGGSQDSARVQIGGRTDSDRSRQAGGRLEDPSKRTAALEAELDKVDEQLEEQKKLKKDALEFLKTPSKSRTTQQTIDAANTIRATTKKIDELESTRDRLETQLSQLPRTVK